jgi:IS1 family transposase
MRSTARMTGVDRETVDTPLSRVGDGCSSLLNDTMRDLPCKRLEIDELWAFVGKKQRHVTKDDDATRVGDAWTYVAIDADTKLVPTFLVGKRDEEHTRIFIADGAARLSGRVQISTNGLRTYIAAIGASFGTSGVDYAQVVKSYEAEPSGPGRCSPPKVTGVEKQPIFGEPLEEFVSPSYAERMNLSIRTTGRCYTRLTNAFSKRVERHIAATALLLANYNFVRKQKTLRSSPAMAAGICPTLWSTEELVAAALDGVRP